MIRTMLLLALLAAPVSAQVRPVPGPGDPRLQLVQFNPDQVVQLAVAPGFQTTVMFDAGERIETIAVGDSVAWQVTANKRGDYLFVKNLEGGRDTNMTVVTDARIYSFELTGGSGTGEAAYVVRFTYPDVATAVKSPPPPTVAYKYRLAGARAIRPSEVRIEPDRISIAWPDSAPLPAVFRIDDDGAESLVNGEMQHGRFVVEGLPAKLVFRLDRAIATAVRVRDRKPI